MQGTYPPNDLVQMRRRVHARVHQRIDALHHQLRAAKAQQGVGGRGERQGGEGVDMHGEAVEVVVVVVRR